MSKVRAVFLDLGWTLAYPRRSMWEIFADLSTTAGAPTTAEACEQLMRAVWSSAQDQAERLFHGGARYADSDAEFAGLFTQMGRLIFAQMGVYNGHEMLMQRFLQAFWNEENWVVFPDTLAVLAALRARGMRLGVLSNAPSDLPRFLQRLGVAPYLDFTVVSAIEGVKKPDRRIFEIALARVGVPATDVLHVGDMYIEDILGGRAAGLQTLLIERGQHALFPNFAESHGRALEAAAVIKDLTQLLEHVAPVP